SLFPRAIGGSQLSLLSTLRLSSPTSTTRRASSRPTSRAHRCRRNSSPKRGRPLRCRGKGPGQRLTGNGPHQQRKAAPKARLFWSALSQTCVSEPCLAVSLPQNVLHILAGRLRPGTTRPGKSSLPLSPNHGKGVQGACPLRREAPSFR